MQNGKITKLLLILLLIGVIGGLVVLNMWEPAPPTVTVQKTLDAGSLIQTN